MPERTTWPTIWPGRRDRRPSRRRRRCRPRIDLLGQEAVEDRARRPARRARRAPPATSGCPRSARRPRRQDRRVRRRPRRGPGRRSTAARRSGRAIASRLPPERLRPQPAARRAPCGDRGGDRSSVVIGHPAPSRRRGYHRARGQRRRRPRGPAPRAARPRRADAERPGDRPGVVGAVRLRQHDLQLRRRVRRDRAVPRQRPPVRRARRQRPAVDRDRRQRRAQRPRLADPRRHLATAAAGACRSCCSSPRCASAPTFFIADVPADRRAASCSSSPTSPTRRR